MAHAKFVEQEKPEVELRLTYKEAAALFEILRCVDLGHTSMEEDEIYHTLYSLGMGDAEPTIEMFEVHNGILMFRDKVPF